MTVITCPIKYPLSFNISKQVLRTRNNLVALSKADPSINKGLTVTQRGGLEMLQSCWRLFVEPEAVKLCRYSHYTQALASHGQQYFTKRANAMAALQAGAASLYNGAVCISLLRLLWSRVMSMLLSLSLITDVGSAGNPMRQVSPQLLPFRA